MESRQDYNNCAIKDKNDYFVPSHSLLLVFTLHPLSSLTLIRRQSLQDHHH